MVVDRSSAVALHGGRVRSPDGTSIGYLVVGTGPTLLCLHGALGGAMDWLPVARLLAEDYRVVVMDRRGHGASDSGVSGHSLALEYEDVAAVLAAQPEPPAAVLGHSFGACLSLTMALTPSGAALPDLVAVEPPLLMPIRPVHVAELRARLATGAWEEAVVWGMREVQRFDEATMSAMRSSPRGWGEIVAAAPTMLRHWEMTVEFPAELAAFRAVAQRTLLLHGSETDAQLYRGPAEVLSKEIPDAQLEVVEGHRHLSMLRDPAPVAERIRAFLA